MMRRSTLPWAFSVFCLGAWSQAGATDVALVYADQLGAAEDVSDKIMATGLLDSVDFIDAELTTPSLSELGAYDAVLVWSNRGFGDATLLGDVLADYSDAGGGVVVAQFANGIIPIGGRFVSDGYEALAGASLDYYFEPYLQLVVTDALHPVLDGVLHFDGGEQSYRSADAVLGVGADEIAQWSNGDPLIGVMEGVHGSPTVGLNFYPASSDWSVGLWTSITDGGLIMANALVWVHREQVVTLTTSGTCPGLVTLDVGGVTPSGSVALLSAVGPGVGSVPAGPCAGATTGLDAGSMRLRQVASTDAAGVMSVTVDLPGGACGSSLQAIDTASCAVSEVATIP